MALYLCGLLPINIWSQVNHEKNIKQISTEGHSTKSLISALQKCQDHEVQGKTEQLLQTGGDEGARTIKGCGILGGTLEQGKNLRGNSADFRVRSEV